ncbi:M28 family peptidase [Rhodopirellula halodulae]|uniref:M28 family peptidase n=1 Tax=Rhodopirellula halodulae TaxID=2894198 RepID=UPI001E2938CF|nr:M28 family peptidase [Rhodopirellula sp. JC737]MCC9658422.1 M28 family peptidase [Rhodopirellula sp. JC737]
MTRRNWISLGQTGRWKTLAGVIVMAAVFLLGRMPITEAEDLSNNVAAATDANLRADLRYLTSEELAGRNAVGKEIQLAAEHVAERFQQIGLDTHLYGDSAFQPVEMATGSEPTSRDDNRLTWWTAESNPSAIALDSQFSPLAIGALSGDVESDLVWLGYGIRAPEYGYDDYQALADAMKASGKSTDRPAEGKIVMMLRKEPGFANPDSPFDGVKNTRHAFFDTKIATAIAEGAAGVLLINDPASVRESVQRVENNYAAEDRRVKALQMQLNALPAEATKLRSVVQEKLDAAKEMFGIRDLAVDKAGWGLLGVAEAGMRPRLGDPVKDPITGETTQRPAIPVASISRDAADRILKQMAANAVDDEAETFAGGLTVVEAAIDSDFQPRGIAAESLRARLQVGLTKGTATSPNVLGVLEGKGELADETIVIGAHYDHVGMGGQGSLAPGTIEIHNGADDNASGTATMLAVAKRVVAHLADKETHRRVLFIAFTGEERGLLGSKYYCQQPRFPISKTVAMINMDMVGRLRDNELTVYGTGTSDDFENLVNELNDGLPETGAAPDSRPFKLNLVATGYGPSDHASFYEAGVPVLFFFTGLHSDYHRPSDDFEKLNMDGMIRITDIVSQAANRIATSPRRPSYTQTNKDFQIRRQMTVMLGVQLDPTSNQVIDVMDPSAAKDGGVLEGDQLVKAGSKPIQSINDLREELRSKSPGDVLNLTVLRDGETVELSVRLRAR